MKTKWKTPEGITIAWAVPNNAWFALWPARANRMNQQVLKIAGTDAMDSWLKETYGQQYGLASHQRDTKLGTTPRGKIVWLEKSPGSYKGWTAADHEYAARIHQANRTGGGDVAREHREIAAHLVARATHRSAR